MAGSALHHFLKQAVHTCDKRLAIAVDDSRCMPQAQAEEPAQDVLPWVWVAWFRIPAEVRKLLRH